MPWPGRGVGNPRAMGMSPFRARDGCVKSCPAVDELDEVALTGQSAPQCLPGAWRACPGGAPTHYSSAKDSPAAACGHGPPVKMKSFRLRGVEAPSESVHWVWKGRDSLSHPRPALRFPSLAALASSRRVEFTKLPGGVTVERYIIDESGERTAVVLAIEEYEALLRAAEDADDRRAIDEVRDVVARGEEEMVPYREAREEWRAARAGEASEE